MRFHARDSGSRANSRVTLSAGFGVIDAADDARFGRDPDLLTKLLAGATLATCSAG